MPTAESRGFSFGGLIGTGWSACPGDWPSHDRQLLEKAWRPSTLSTYRAHGERWRHWAASNGVSIFDPSPLDLARFLEFLSIVENLSSVTIAMQKSVIATFSNPLRSEELRSSPFVRYILKAIAQKCPLPQRTIWHVSSLLSWIRDNPPDPDNHFQVSRPVAPLPLLASGRRVHDLTLLSCDDGYYQELGADLVFWPPFGSKTDTSSRRHSGWHLCAYPLEPALDPVAWCKRLVVLDARGIGSCNVRYLFSFPREVAWSGLPGLSLAVGFDRRCRLQALPLLEVAVRLWDLPDLRGLLRWTKSSRRATGRNVGPFSVITTVR